VSRPSFGELGGQDPYDILELPSGASEADVRAARKRLLRKYHPDLPSGDLRRTQLITAAADLLLDPLRRIGYYDLRDEESRRTVFATADVADDRHEATRPGHGPGASAAPAQPIRPTFITPPGSPSPPGRPFPPTRTATGPAGPPHAPRTGWEQAPDAGWEQAPDAGWEPAPRTAGHEPPPVHADRGHDDAAGGPAAASRWNALAVASVVAILTWTPIPLILGLLSLRQIRRYGQRGRRLALTGVIVGAIFVLIYVYVLVLPGF
jgi:hypothetical protein